MMIEEFYRYLDNYGVPYTVMEAVISVSVNINTMHVTVSNGITESKIFRPEYDILLSEFPELKNLPHEQINILVLEYFRNILGLCIQSLDDLFDLRFKDSAPYLVFSTIDDIRRVNPPARKVVGDMQFFESDPIESMGCIEEITGDLGLSGTQLKSLGELKKIGGSFWVAQSDSKVPLISLGALKSVGGNLNLKNTDISDLGSLEFVGGNLNIRGCKVTNLKSLKFVGGNILVTKNTPKLEFDNIDLKGKIKYYKSPPLS